MLSVEENSRIVAGARADPDAPPLTKNHLAAMVPPKAIRSRPKSDDTKRIDAEPEHVDDPECPYDPNDEKAVNAFWKNAVVVKGGGYETVRAALAEKRKPGQRGLGRRPPRVAINIRLSPEVLGAFKATGEGWQTKISGALQDWLQTHTPA